MCVQAQTILHFSFTFSTLGIVPLSQIILSFHIVFYLKFWQYQLWNMLKVQKLPFIYGLPHNYWERCDTGLHLEAYLSAGILYGWGKPFYSQANDWYILNQAALCKIKPFICLFIKITPCIFYLYFVLA